MGIFGFSNKKKSNSLFDSEEWKQREAESAKWHEHQKAVSSVSRRYYAGLEKLQSDWSVLYNLKDYVGERAKRYETDCKTNIKAYHQMAEIDRQYGENSALSVPAYKRLAMLYEKQGNYEKSVSVCKETLSHKINTDDARSRLIRMVKKSGRTLTNDEIQLIDQ